MLSSSWVCPVLHSATYVMITTSVCTRLCAGLDAVAFTLIVDDLVYPDGRTLMGVLGGGGMFFGVTATATCY